SVLGGSVLGGSVLGGSFFGSSFFVGSSSFSREATTWLLSFLSSSFLEAVDFSSSSIFSLICGQKTVVTPPAMPSRTRKPSGPFHHGPRGRRRLGDRSTSESGWSMSAKPLLLNPNGLLVTGGAVRTAAGRAGGATGVAIGIAGGPARPATGNAGGICFGG